MTATAKKNPALHVEDFVQTLVLQGRIRSTAEKNGRTVRQFLDWSTGRRATADLDREWASWLAQARAAGMSAASIRSRLYTGKAFLGYLGESAPLLRQYKLPPLAAPVPHPLPEGIAGVRKMISVSEGPGRWLIALQGLAGLRVAEARTLRREDVDAARGVLVVKGKGEKTRRVPVSRELGAILAEMPVTGPLVGLSDSGARAAVTRAALRAGVVGSDGGGVSSHDLRATFATAAFDRSKDILLVSRLLGHSSVTVTQAYLATGQAELAAAVEL